MAPEARRRDPLTVAAIVAATVFVLLGIGSPLLGATVFAGTDGLSLTSPYLDDGLAGTQVRNDYLNDTYDAMLPSVDLFTETGSEWNPYVTGGVPLSATPNYALYSPLMLPHYLLPGWLAPAYTKLLELAVTILGCVLFLRRIGLGRPAAVLGGVVFASSAFLVMWTNWPQTQVAAMIPWAFWAAEGIVSRRRAVDAVALAGAAAVMLLAGFPAVTAFTLLTVAGYLVTRLLAQRRAAAQTVGRPLALAGVGIGGALALAAVQLLPFAYFYSSWHIDGRAQTPADHMSPAYLVTLFAPWAFGGASRFDPDRPFWYLADNLVEASAYLGAASLVLVVAGVALAGRSRSLLPRGAWLFFAVAAGGWLAVIFTALPLHLLVHLPIFSSNFVGRARSVLGFLLAVLAAAGFDLLLRHRSAWRPAAWRSSRSSRWAIAVAAVAVLGVLGLVVKARALAAGYGPLAVSNANREVLLGLALLAVATVAVLTLLMVGRRPVARATAAYVLLGLVLVQALSYVGPYWPRVGRDTYYPVTDTHAFLAANLGHERYLGTGAAMFTGTNSAYRLRGLSGHSFINQELATLLAGVPDNAVQAPTQVFLDADPEQAASPVLDRLAGRYFVTSPREPVFGPPRFFSTDGSTLTLAPLRTVVARMPTAGPVRAVGFVPAAGPLPAPSPDAYVEVDVRGPDGTVLAHGRRVSVGMTLGSPFLVAVTGEDIPSGTPLTAAITLHAPAALTIAGVAAAAGASGPSTVDGPASLGPGSPPVDVATFAVAAGADRLKLVYAGSSVIYQRLDALPRIRWASSTVVEPDRDRRVALLAGGSLPADRVVLDAPGPAAAGRPASVSIRSDEPDRIDVRVDAQGGGYLVVADAIQAGWVVTVDGAPAQLVPADQAVVAVAVSTGVHDVQFRYSSPYHGVGGWISLAAVVAAAGVLGLARRRPIRPAEDPQ